MKKYIFLLCIIALLHANIYSQTNIPIINGFSKYIAGVEEDEDCSCTPDANIAMTARCTNEKEYIEWETDPVPSNYDGNKISFIWSGGYYTGTKDEEGAFSLYINNKFLFSFATASRIKGGDWQVNNGTAQLSFKNRKYYNRSGNTKKDYWGFFILTVPTAELSDNKTLKIKIKGDASGSLHWFRTMKYQLLPKIKINEEKIVSKDKTGKPIQWVQVSVDHYSYPVPFDIFADNKKVKSANLNFGRNDFNIKYDAVKIPTQKTIEIKINGQSTKKQFTIKPVRDITFYLLAHSHVDIGYTNIQTEIEKKQWKNIDDAIKLSEQSSGYGNGNVFKWNTEVLWAVKSYLGNFPGKRKAFFDAVKKGWIGLDADYANILTGLCRPEELYRLVAYSNQLKKEIGVKIESAVISDVPGYTWGIVQVFADNGIKYFSVGTNEGDRLGSILKTWGDKPFYWQSPSGKNKVLVWFAGKGYSWFHHWSLTKDNISPLLKYLDELEENNYPYNIVQLRYTLGDNGGPDPSLPGFVKKWNETHVTPKFKLTTTEEMFKDFEKEYGSIIPTYKGDLSPYWEDGAGSSAKETALNRETSEKLNQLEILYTLNGRKKFPFQDFDEAWKNVLLYSEHTWGSWNSISDPESKLAKDVWEIKKSFALKADSIAQKLFANLEYQNISPNGTVEYLDVWNTNSWTRSDVVTIPSAIKTAGDYLIDDSGKQIATQRLSNGDLVFIASSVPPLSSRHYRLLKKNPGKIAENAEDKDQNGLMKNILPVSITSLVDSNSPYGLDGFVYTGKNASDPKIIPPVSPRQKEKGPVVNSIVYESTAPGCNNLTREIRSYIGLSKRVIINTIDKKKIYEKENLRFVFPFKVKNPVTRIDIAWAVIRPEIDQLPGANKNYFTVQRWVDVSNDKRGITLATVDAPLIELGGMNAEAWMVKPHDTWFKHTGSSAKIFSWVMNNSWNTNYRAEQDGIVTFKYALKPHKQFDYSGAYRFGVEQSQPLQVTFSDNSKKIEQPIKLDQNSAVVVTSLKPSHDERGLMIRLYNPTNNKSKTEITLAKNSVIYLSSGDEKEYKRINNKLTFAPFEVKTIKIITK